MDEIEAYENIYNEPARLMIESFETKIRQEIPKKLKGLAVTFVMQALKKAWNIFLTEDDENYVVIYRTDTNVMCCGTGPPKYRQILIHGNWPLSEQLGHVENFFLDLP